VKKVLSLMALCVTCVFSFAQEVNDIYFNLYTDSLKKGFYNYINIEGKFSNGHLLPLDTNHIILTCNTGFFKGNDLFIDSSYTGETVQVKAVLKDRPAIWKETTIYIRKRPFTEPLKTNDEVFNEVKKKKDKKHKKTK
jgi:hypothetical protein